MYIHVFVHVYVCMYYFEWMECVCAHVHDCVYSHMCAHTPMYTQCLKIKGTFSSLESYISKGFSY